MIISPGRRFIFVHIPKTGGTALSLALEARAMKDDILIGDTPKAKRRRGRLKRLDARGRLWKHSTLADIEGVLPPDVEAECLVFTLVRNPWDRMVSYYHWLCAQTFDHPAVTLARSSDFGGFVGHPQTRAAFTAMPFGAYVRGSDGAERGAVFLRLEHLDEDIAPVEAHLGFALTPLPVANRSDRTAGHRAHYTAQTRALVAELCAEDIARFGYAF
ncbi:sulfotransferase family 2 domain-containing protein [Oceaniglobus roseus]|uniref:sulfotransferase family 2 domain-containing protein n=1 Tax=Oceaniglobus roseus TaxID=1737570 RepID=UPI000C7F6D7B|nr:sulfotransferase family 2 domain-containing protein [Kandeliimicrobium roseum]